MGNDLAFSYRSARSPAIMSAIGAVIVIESIAVHFALAARNPRLYAHVRGAIEARAVNMMEIG